MENRTNNFRVIATPPGFERVRAVAHFAAFQPVSLSWEVGTVKIIAQIYLQAPAE